MLSTSNVTARMAASYYKADDYYTHGSPPTEWVGKAAEALGLNGEVKPEAFAAALQGELPHGIRIEGKGGDSEKRRAGTDLTFSAPKSVSIAALVDGDKRVIDAHDKAVKAALSRTEGLIQTGRGRDAVTTGNMIAATVRHETSRVGDPQLHTHSIVINATCRQDGAWRAIENRDIMQHKKELDAVYLSAMAHELKKIGYEIRQTKNGFELAHISERQIKEFSGRSQAIEEALEKQGLTRETATAKQLERAALATRDKKADYDRETLATQWRARNERVAGGQQEIHKSIQQQPQEISHGRTAGNNINETGSAEQANPNRAADAGGIDTSRAGAAPWQRLPDLQAGAPDAGGKRAADTVLSGDFSRHPDADSSLPDVDRRGESGRVAAPEPLQDPFVDRKAVAQAVALAKHHCQERESVFRMTDLRREALMHGIGQQVSPKAINAEIQRQIKAGEIQLVGDGKQATTAEAISTEQRMLRAEGRGRGACMPIDRGEQAYAIGTMATRVLRHQEIAQAYGLNAEQARAVEMIATTRNRIVGIEGRAGTGKTTTLQAVREVAEAQGYKMVGLAPSHSAVKALGEAGIEAKTLQSWLADKKAMAALDSKTIVVIDEAGLIGSKNLTAALARIEKTGARCVLVGDTKQYQAVEAGKPLAQLRERGMQVATITEMQRQRNAAAPVREAAQLSSDRASAGAALQKLDSAGHVREVKDAAARRIEIAQDYAALPADKRTDTLILAGTNEARREINAQVRENLGLAGKGEKIEVFAREDITKAELKRLGSYAVGAAVRFERDYKAIDARKGEVWKVAEVKPDRLVIERSDGKRADYQPARASGHSLGKVEQIEIAVGERMRIKETSKEIGIKNGDRGTVTQITNQEISIRLDSGKTIDLPRDRAREIDHGYAVTGHSAQGLGAGRVLIDKDSTSLTTDHRSFYTDLTRTKADVTVYTDDKTKLAERIAGATEKSSALDAPAHTPDARGPAVPVVPARDSTIHEAPDFSR